MGYSKTTQRMVERNAGFIDPPSKREVIKVACAKHDVLICKCVAPCPACACMAKVNKAFSTPFEAKLRGGTLR